MPRYWLWVGLQILTTLSTLGIIVNVIPYLISVGYSPQEAATMFAFKSVAGLLGSFTFGILSSRWDIKPLLMVGMAIGGFAILALLLGNDPSGNYSTALMLCAACMIAALIPLAFLPKRIPISSTEHTE